MPDIPVKPPERTPSPSHEAALSLPAGMPFQRRNWLAERVAWIAMAALILAAAMGAFGPGLLSRVRSASATNAITADYPATLRRDAPASLTLTLDAPADAPLTTISLAGDLPTTAHIDSILPQPAATRSTSEGLDLVLHTATSGRTTVRIEFRPNRPGPMHTAIRLSGDTLDLNHFVYP